MKTRAGSRSAERRHAFCALKRARRRAAFIEALECRRMLDAADKTAWLPRQYDLIDVGDYLTAPSAQPPLQVAMDYLAASAPQLGVLPGDIRESLVTDQ